MLRVYLGKENQMPAKVYVSNDIWFDKKINNNRFEINDRVKKIIKQIDGVKYIDKGYITSKFINAAVPVFQLSTGCKTAINVYVFKDNVFYIGECGKKALDVIFKFNAGKVYCNYYQMPNELNNEIKVIGNDHDKYVVDNIGDLRKVLYKYY